MDSQAIVGMIQNVGFPIAISIYLLMRTEKKIDLLSNSISELAKILAEK
nr:YvrJ family protein [uncultured Peptostreptococcus sp.]